MHTQFTRTLAFLDREERGGGLAAWLWCFALLALIWSAWLGFATTTVYAVSEEGRLLAAGAASPVQSTVAGLVTTNRLELGRAVRTGDALLELDTSAQRLRRAEEQARCESLDASVASARQIIDAERGLGLASVRAVDSRTAAAATRARVSARVATLAERQNELVEGLRAASLTSGMAALAQAEAMQKQRGELSIHQAEAANASADAERTRREVDVRLLGLERELSELEGSATACRALLSALDWEIARRTLRAPIDGTVADLDPLPVGATLMANQVVANIVPAAPLRWVAYFSTREAVGRVHEGQAARIRMDAFPWTAYGELRARVVRVGSEQRQQRIRAELELTSGNDLVPLSHGMSGSTDVEVESLSPLRLLLRLAGQAAAGQAVAWRDVDTPPAASRAVADRATSPPARERLDALPPSRDMHAANAAAEDDL